MTKHDKGFTLLEALVASVILGGAVVGIGTVSTRCLRQAQLTREYEIAWQLLDRQLVAIDYMGLETFLEQGITNGDIEDFGPTFHWRANVTPQGIDDLHLVSVAIHWEDRAGGHRVSAATMLNSATGLASGAYGQEDEDMSGVTGND